VFPEIIVELFSIFHVVLKIRPVWREGGRKEGRKEGREGGRKEGRKEGRGGGSLEEQKVGLDRARRESEGGREEGREGRLAYT